MKLKLIIAKVILPFVNWHIRLGDKKREPQELYKGQIVKASSAEIIVTEVGDKPYFEIKYSDLKDGKQYLGYSSYKLKNVIEWRKEYFKMVRDA